MPLMAAVFPISPGKLDEWREWMAELNGPRHEEFAESRRRVGLHERTFLQSTPMGDLVIITLEGDDPGKSFSQLLASTDAFSTWFTAKATSVHGIDPKQALTGPMPELVVDSEKATVPA